MAGNKNEMKEKKKGEGLCPLTDQEVKLKMKYFENLISELEWRRIIFDRHCEDERSREYRETKNTIKKIAESYKRKEQTVAKDSIMFESRMAGAARLRMLQEKDKNVTDVILAVHHRLGRVDLVAHKKAYRRILYALIVQGLCRLLEEDVILIFRKSDVKLGRSVMSKAREKFKKITGMHIQMTVSDTRYLPVESCGGVDMSSVNGRHMVNNSLAVRLDQLLHKASPMIRIALYGLNKNRNFFDLSKMSGSPTLFDFPSSEDTSKETSSEEENSDVEPEDKEQKEDYSNRNVLPVTFSINKSSNEYGVVALS
ncbi:V-type proton ATPase subunit E [Halyomorpha halys]|uniref:V-type proton ATPase subunit E n=1 Tax=Halyomorpha halys TaxID=286706 RepID=UPI0006D5198C|nr:V-type proton ATPase subunit E [Halyomorpha halys]